MSTFCHEMVHDSQCAGLSCHIIRHRQDASSISYNSWFSWCTIGAV
ncbi:MAG: hypothetical protein WCE54_01150 [Ignavibacteriaceae bacterium]